LRSAIALWRLARSLVHLLRGTLICLFIFPSLTPPERLQRTGCWCRQLLGLLGLAVQSQGAPHDGPVLWVANHVSWLDILVINAVRPARFVSKADVRRWPLIGWLVACGGTLFIERERKRDALRVLHQVSEALKAGDTIALFPEGTTSDGRGVLPFHANLLQAALSAGAPVQAIVLRFADADQAVSEAAAYVGEVNLVQSVWRVVRARRLTASVRYLPVEPGGSVTDRRALSERLRGRILESLEAGGR
jgi:1-acyl-sn-glycerol-3-phosphate acyltransferase